MTPDFQLHPQLSKDCLIVGNLPLSQLLMMNDSQYPWFILVPRRQSVREIFHLTEADRHQFINESCIVAEQMTAIYQPDKLNIAAIGNLVPQLHIHHVARYQNDIAWPAPIWGKFAATPFETLEAEHHINRMRGHLTQYLVD